MIISKLNSITLISFIVSFLGLIPLGFLNATSAHISAYYGLSYAVVFAIGVTCVEILYVGLVIYFLRKLNSREDLMRKVSWISFLILISFSVYYFYESFQMMDTISMPDGGYLAVFSCGITFGFLNFLAIVFWLTWTTFFIKTNILTLSKSSIVRYVLGIALGTLSALGLFAIAGSFFMDFLKENSLIMNITVALIFLIMAISKIWKIKKVVII